LIEIKRRHYVSSKVSAVPLRTTHKLRRECRNPFPELHRVDRVLFLAPWLTTLPTPSKPMSRSPVAFFWKATMKIVRFEGNREASQALVLSVAGVIFAMLMWNLMMLLWY
jgi:hypothetical protein